MYSKNKIVEKRVKKNVDMPLELFEAFAILLKLTVCTFFFLRINLKIKTVSQSLIQNYMGVLRY